MGSCAGRDGHADLARCMFSLYYREGACLAYLMRRDGQGQEPPHFAVSAKVFKGSLETVLLSSLLPLPTACLPLRTSFGLQLSDRWHAPPIFGHSTGRCRWEERQSLLEIPCRGFYPATGYGAGGRGSSYRSGWAAMHVWHRSWPMSHWHIHVNTIAM